MREMKRSIKKLGNRLINHHKLRNGQPIAPIFIIGSGRSGNTLLRRILHSHPDIYIPPETYVMGQSIGEFREHAYLDWNILCRMVLSQFAFSQDFHTFPTPYLRPLYKRLLDTPAELRSFDHILNEFYLYMAAQVKPAATTWGDKTPQNVFFLDDIYEAFPSGRYIHILRDGYDVVASYLEMGRYTTVRAAANRWVKSIEHSQTFGRRHPEQFIEVRYEDLVRSPDDVVQKLCGFLGIEFSSSLLEPPADIDALGDIQVYKHLREVSKRISPDSIGKGRRSLSKNDLLETREIIGEKAIHLGYD